MGGINISMRSSPVYRIATWALLLFCIVLLVKFAPNLYSPENISADDFGHFWASGKLFLEQNNPYDMLLLSEIQARQGEIISETSSIVPLTLNPPWSLLIFSGFGLLEYDIARVMWLIFNIAIMVTSIKLLWEIYYQSKEKLWLALLICFGFSPSVSVLLKGQLTPLVLLAIAGILMYTQGQLNVWWAAACLWLILLKPQLFYLLWPILGFWLITHRQWKLLISGVSIGLVASAILLIVNPQIFSQYFTAIQEYPYDQWATPTVGSYLRYFWLGPKQFWIQYLLAFMGIAWSTYYYFKNQPNWAWKEQLPILSIVSLLTSPYAWTYDQIIILPAILTASIFLIRSNRPVRVIIWLWFIAINSANLLLHMILSDFWFIWLAPMYTLWCICAYRQQNIRTIKSPHDSSAAS